jgi:hypothetical protein
MKAFILGIIIITSFTAMGESKLQCYEKYHADIENLDTVVINGYETLFSEEETLLDQYFNPGNYFNGPHVPFLMDKKITILNRRSQVKNWINQRSAISQNLSRDLSNCLKNAKN